MRSKFILCSLAVATFLSPALAAEAPVDCDHLMAWMAGSVSASSLIATVQNRGSAVSLTPASENELRTAGGSPELLITLHRVQPSTGVHSSCSATLAKAASLAHRKQYEDADDVLARLIDGDPHNGALHFALGYIKQQLGDWNSAFDEYSTSKEAEPGFAPVHNRLALVFYQADDSDNAIGEARTALSMDFNDPEAYRMLGLGHYANEQFESAMNAFQESLARDPKNAEVYYEMGLVARDQGAPEQAIGFFLKSLQLKPQVWQVHSSLGEVMGQQKRFDEALIELNTAKNMASREPSVREALANVFYGKGDYDASIAEYRELFRLDPNWRRGHDCRSDHRALLQSCEPKTSDGTCVAVKTRRDLLFDA